MLTLLWRDLQYRKWRVLSTVLLIGIVMTLLFLMTGLVGQFNREPFLASQRAGDDRVWLVPAGSSGPFTSGEILSAAVFEQVPGVEPVLVGRAAIEGNPVMLVGRGYDGFEEPKLTGGRHPTAAGELVVDTVTELAVGDEVLVSNQPAVVVGTTHDATVLAGLPLVFGSLDFAQTALAAGQPVVNAGLLAEAPAVVPSELRLMTGEDVGEDARLLLENAVGSITLVQALLWLIASVVVAAVVYITALEKTRDVSVLKAVGGRNRAIAATLLGQALVMTLLGVALAAVLQNFVRPFFPLAVSIPASAWWKIPIASALVALAAGAAGVWRISKTHPSEAFG
ncbi:MAG: ABC transporter permease [Acidimicrobiales bacterium]